MPINLIDVEWRNFDKPRESTMSKRTKLRLAIVLFVLPLALTACGGGGGGGGGGVQAGDEGTETAPVLITVGVARPSSVAGIQIAGPTLTGSSYYTFTAPRNTPATISLTNTQSDLLWELSSSAGFSGIPVAITNPPATVICDTTNSVVAASVTCTTIPLVAGASYYLQVDADQGVGSTFTLLVTQP